MIELQSYRYPCSYCDGTKDKDANEESPEMTLFVFTMPATSSRPEWHRKVCMDCFDRVFDMKLKETP